MPKELLFSVTKKDLVRQTFAVGGPGGQHKNAKQNCVRFIHPPSGAVGQGTVHREQYRNEREALKHLAETKEFKKWHKAECARRLSKLGITVEDFDKAAEDMGKLIGARVDKMIEEQLRDGLIMLEYVSGE